MSKIIPYTEYSQEEKQIFTNHFITKKDNSKKEFEAYINRFYKTLPLPKDDQPYIDPKHSYNAMVKKGVQFNTHHTLWDLNTKDNLVTHFLSQPDFYIDNKALHRLNFVHPDWNHQNSKGKNALILLAQRGEVFQIEKVIKDFNLDLNAKDRDDKYFTHYLFSIPLLQKKPENMEEGRVLVRAVTYFQKINKILEENPTHLDVSPTRLNRMSKEWNDTLALIQEVDSKNSKPLTHDAMKFVINNWETVNNKIEDMKKLKFAADLEHDMPEKAAKRASRKI